MYQCIMARSSVGQSRGTSLRGKNFFARLRQISISCLSRIVHFIKKLFGFGGFDESVKRQGT